MPPWTDVTPVCHRRIYCIKTEFGRNSSITCSSNVKRLKITKLGRIWLQDMCINLVVISQYASLNWRDTTSTNITPTPLSTVVAATFSKMAAPQSDEPGNEGSFRGLFCYFRPKTFLCLMIIWLVKGVPSMVIIRATIKELFKDKHAKRENGSSVVLFSGEYGSSIWRVR